MQSRRLRHSLLVATLLLGPAPALAIVGGAEVGTTTMFDAVGGLGFANRVGLEGPLPTPDDTWHCTATLIAPDLVLTARHCLGAGNPFVPYDPTGLAVVFRRNPDGSLGVSDMAAADRGLSSYFRVRLAETRLPESGADDIAIARLATPVTHILPAKTLLRGGEIVTGAAITLGGWGRSTAAVGAPLIGLKVCGTTALGYWAPPNLVQFPFYQSASCGPVQHDSGGPIFVQSPAGELRVVGLVNAGNFGEGLPAKASLPALAALVHAPFAGADLSIDGYAHEQRFYRFGEDFAIDVTLRNSGSASASGIRLDLEIVDGHTEQFRQHLRTESVSGSLAPGETRVVTLRFAIPADASQTYHALAVRVASNDDVFVANNRHIQSPTGNGPSAYFYAAPRVLEYGDVYSSFVYGPADSVVGSVSVYERANGEAVALVMGPGGNRVVEGLSLQDRSLSLSLPTATGELAFTATFPRVPMAQQSGPGTPLVFAADVGLRGTVYRDSRFGNVVGHGRANPGAGYYTGVFTDAEGGSVHAIVQPSMNVYVVAPGAGARNRAFGLWSRTTGRWASSPTIPDLAETTAAIRFDPSVDQYVAEGTWTVSEKKESRPFRLIREASRLTETTRCHDDGECQAIGLGRCDATRLCTSDTLDAGPSSSSSGSLGASSSGSSGSGLPPSADGGAEPLGNGTDGSSDESSGCRTAPPGAPGSELSALALVGLACLLARRACTRA